MSYLFVWFTKITGWLTQKIFFRTKIYYEDKKVQGRHIKGPAILISNHTSIVDFGVLYFVFFFRALRFQVAEVLYTKPMLKHLLKWAGSVYVDRNSFDFSFVDKSKDILDKGGVVGVFPEARIPLKTEKTPLPFKSSAAYLAYISGIKVIPVAVNGNYNFKHRARILIGTPFYVSEMWDPNKSRKENLTEVSEKMRKRIAGMMKDLKKREERDSLRPPFYYFHFDLCKIQSALPALICFRPKTVYTSPAAKRKYKEGVLFFSNHTCFRDPMYVMLGIWYRRIHFITSQEIIDNPKMHFVFTKVFRAIPVDRENTSLGFMKRVTAFLEAKCALCIFPEGHINTSDDIVDSFKNGAVLMALKGKVPLVPLYVMKRKHWYNRQVMFQGEAIDIIKMYGNTPTMSQIEEAGRLCRDRELELARLAEEYYKNK